MSDKIKEIAKLRLSLIKLGETEGNALEQMWESEAYQKHEAIIMDKQRIKADLSAAEAEYKAECVSDYITKNLQEIVDGKNFPGGKINITSLMEYEDTNAVAWLIEKKFASALKPINKEFKALAKAAKPDFVTFSTVPKMKIDTDLSEFLDE